MFEVHFFGWDDDQERKNNTNFMKYEKIIDECLGFGRQSKRAEAMMSHHSVYQNEPKQTAEVPQCPVCNLRQANEMSKSQLQKDVEMNRFNVDPIPVNLPHQETQELRIKVLELAIESFNMKIEHSDDDKIINTAQRFYTYITKGE